MSDKPLTMLCLASYEKGQDFLREAKAQGCKVVLITLETLADADWPREAIDEVYYMHDMYDRQSLVHAVSYLARSQRFDRIVPLDDFDVEMAASLREHLRVPGMGDTTARYFRDKLAMRVKAQEEGILVPDFCPVINYDQLRDYMSSVPAPWVLKPRSEASSVGIKKIYEPEQLWRTLDTLGDRQSYYVLERYVPGDVFHVDSIVYNREALFAEVHRYASPPLDVTNEGGIFCTTTLRRGTAEEEELKEQNRNLLQALGLVRGVTHTEFIRSREDGRFYFLETAARVGGANIAEMVEASTGVNLWREWAKIEIAGSKGQYQLPEHRQDYAGVVISLARQEWPDTSGFDYPEVVWRLAKKNHVGLIVCSHDADRVAHLLDDAMRRIQHDFHASMPAPDKPTS
jgi:biotin carboxylase